MFDPAGYLVANPDVADTGVAPLLHYIRHGRSEGRALADERHSLAAEIAASGLFDPDFYMTSNPEAAAFPTPLDHFVDHGLAEGLPPSVRFDPALYLDLNPDVAASGVPPLLHYIRHGRPEGRRFPDERAVLAAAIEDSGLFDPAFYTALYPAVTLSNMDPLQHYLEHCNGAVRRPSLEFDPSAYLAAYPDVAAAGVDPLVHLVTAGRAEGRIAPAVPMDRIAFQETRRLIAASGLFDPDFYLARHSAARDRGLDPLLHYILEGAADHVDPSAAFSAIAHVARHPEIIGRGENALVHYLRESLVVGEPPPRLADLRRNSERQPPDREIMATRVASIAYFSRHSFTFDPSGPTTYIAEAVAELAATQPDLAIGDAPDVSIIIPVYGQMPFVAGCLDALAHHRSRHSVEIIVADDTSPAEYRTHLLGAIPWIHYRRNPENLGFLANCNADATAARGRFIVLLNSDTRVLDGWLDELIGSFELFPQAGLVGSKLLNGDGTLQEAGGLYWSDGTAWNYGRGGNPSDPRYCFARQVDWVSGASIALPAAVWREVDGFDTFFRPAYCEDVDLAFRIRQRGYEIWFQPLSCALHFEGMTHGRDDTAGVKAHQVVNLRKLQHRWSGKLPGRRPGGFEPDLEACRSRTTTMLVLDATMHRPDQDAGSVVASQILRAYRDLGFHQTFVPVDGFGLDPRYAADLQRIGVEVLYAPFQHSLADVLQQRTHYEYVLVFRYSVAQVAIDLVRSALPSARIVFSNVDLHFLRMEREAAVKGDRLVRLAASRIQTEELGVFARVDSSLVHTPNERDEVLKRLPAPLDNILVLPWICDIQVTSGEPRQRRDVMFLGGFPHTPNVDAVTFFVGKVWPHLVDRLPADANFLAVGNAPPASVKTLASKRVVVTGHVPTVEPYFAQARVFVAPLRYGAGISGKVIQSLANGVPVVATTLAVDGIGLRDGEHCLIADTPEAIADAVHRLYNEPETWSCLREAGHRFVEANFSWAKAVSICEAALNAADDSEMKREARKRALYLAHLMSVPEPRAQ